MAEQEHRRCAEMGVEVNRVYTLNELVEGDDILFSATGVTGGDLVTGVQQVAKGCARKLCSSAAPTERVI